jgi:hypothetical protein
MLHNLATETAHSHTSLPGFPFVAVVTNYRSCFVVISFTSTIIFHIKMLRSCTGSVLGFRHRENVIRSVRVQCPSLDMKTEENQFQKGCMLKKTE